MKLRRIIALMLVLALTLSGIGVLAADEAGNTDDIEEMLEEMMLRRKLDTLLSIIETYSIYDYPGGEELLLQALTKYLNAHPEAFEEFANALFGTQDDYSHYMEPETFDSSYVMNDSFVGIGIELDSPNNGLVKVVYPHTPADEAGMKSGDFIFSVNGEVVPEGEYYNVFQTKLRGEAGTTVTVGVRRGDETLEFTMVRRKVVLSNVSVEDMGDGIAYVRISHFGDDISTFIDYVNAYTDLDEQGFTSVIFDVRNNNGGDATVLANILNYTLWEKDVVTFTEVSSDGESYAHTSLGLGWKPESVVVLTNRYTASSAEIFAGVLGMVAGATVIGESEYTYGKGVGQFVFRFTDDSLAIITGAEALVGEDYHYHGVGIPSDIVVPPEYTYETQELLPLNPVNAFSPGAKGKPVQAAEQRLAILGYFSGTPDTVFDDNALEALHRYQADKGFRIQDYATSEVLASLKADAGSVSVGDEVIFGYTVHDAALDKAVDFIKAYSGN